MDLAIIGLGRMGMGFVQRLIDKGHEVVGYDLSGATLEQARAAGSTVVEALDDIASHLVKPRIVWMMIPSGEPVDKMIEGLVPHLEGGDIIVDGGNSNYQDSIRRAARLEKQGIYFVDVGTSGGVWGLEQGFSMMVGGKEEAVERLRPILQSLAPAPDVGWGHVGASGAGHFVKMIHNGIEYGLMQAYAEGFAIMQRKESFALDLRKIVDIWQGGSVIRSWLLDLTGKAIEEDPELKGIAPYVPDSGMGRWTLHEAIELDVPAPVITLSVLQRLRSRDQNAYYDRLLAAMRNQFGGHAVKVIE